MLLSSCVEWQFAESGDGLPDRIRAASAAGLTHCEFHLWRDKDMAGIADALEETGITLTGFCVDPRRSIVDPNEREEMLAAVRDSLEAAKRVGSPPLIIASGFRVEGMSDEQLFANAVAVLERAAAMAEEAGVTLLLEPLNTQLFPTMYLVSTKLGLDLVEAVGSPRLKLLYDIYHSHVMGEDVREALAGRIHLVGHVQAAGFPGRNEPGTGELDYGEVMSTLNDLGYQGAIGLEYFPTTESARSLDAARKALCV